MKKAKLFGAIILSAVAVAANADTNADASAQTRANLQILKAIEIAERYTGALAFDAERKDQYGNQYYKVEVTKEDGQPISVWVDVNQGSVVHHNTDFADQNILDVNSAWHISIRNSWNISLSTAIGKAERMTGYDAVRADFDGRGGRDVYEIDLVTPTGQEMEIHVQAENDYDH